MSGACTDNSREDVAGPMPVSRVSVLIAGTADVFVVLWLPIEFFPGYESGHMAKAAKDVLVTVAVGFEEASLRRLGRNLPCLLEVH